MSGSPFCDDSPLPILRARVADHSACQRHDRDNRKPQGSTARPRHANWENVRPDSEAGERCWNGCTPGSSGSPGLKLVEPGETVQVITEATDAHLLLTTEDSW